MTKANKDTRAHLARQFALFDLDQNGLINEAEFQKLLRALGEDAPAETLSLQFAAIDANDDGAVQFDEFIDWWLDYR